MEKFKNKKLLTGLLLASLVLIMIGGTFAAIRFTRISDQNIIKSGKVSMSYTESSNVINLTNALPTEDEIGKNSTEFFDFTIMSKADTNADDNEGIKIPYNLIIEPKAVDSDKDALTNDQIKVYLTKVEGATETQVIAPTKISKLKAVDTNFNLYSTENIHKNNNGTITTNYRLRAWIDYEVESKDWNQASKPKQYKFGVNVNATGELNGTGSLPVIQSTTYNNNIELWKYKSDISKIVFQNELKEVPNTIESWDLSEKDNGSVMGYLTADSNDNTKYIAYIQGDNEVIANENSSYLFQGFTSLKEIEGLEYFNTSNATDMRGIFSGAGSLTNLDLSSFNTSNVTLMTSMFYGVSALQSLDLSSFDTSNVTDMSFMFYMDSSFTNLDLSSFDTSNVIDMRYMFYKVSSLTSLDLSSFNTSNVTDMNSMFRETGALKELDLRNFNTSKVTDMEYMFYNASSLTSLDLTGNFDTSNATSMRSMFYGVSALQSLDLRNFNTSKVTNMQYMFEFARSLTSLDLSSFDTSNVTNMSNMFDATRSLTSLDLSSFDTSNVIDMSSMFDYADSLISLDLSSFDTSNVTDMNNMFSMAVALKSLKLSSAFDTSNVTNMYRMFAGTHSLTSIDLSSFDTSNVTNMSSMFEHAEDLTSIDLSSFDTSNVTNMSEMFYSTYSLTSIDLSSFDTSNVTNMNSMFACAGLKSLDFRKATFDKVSDSSDMFVAVRSANINIITKNATTKAWFGKQTSRATITITTVE